MNNGTAQAILISQREAFKTAAAEQKITPKGMLAYTLQNNKPNVISTANDNGTGYLRDVKLRARTRSVPGQSVLNDGCEITHVQPFYEVTVPSTHFLRRTIFFDWSIIKAFTEDALATRTTGTPATTIMMEVWDSILLQANGLLDDINGMLITDQAANFGFNAGGSAAARTVNFPATISGSLNDGISQLIDDAMSMEVDISTASIVGAGNINKFYIQNMVKSANYAGINNGAYNLPKFYYDPKTQTTWGSNQFGLFEKDAVQFLNIARFRGATSGRWGGSNLFTLTLPVADTTGNSFSEYIFDVQVKEEDCPVDRENATVYGGNLTNGRGMSVSIMSSFVSVNIPSNAYQTTDRLYQVNGTHRYSATNS